MATDQKQQPSLHQPKGDTSEVAALKAQVDRLEQMLMTQIASAAPRMSPDTLWAQQHEKEMRIQADLDKHAALFLRTTQERTQWAANQLNPDAKRLFKVQVGWCPEVILRASDDVMAKAWYERLCGITSVGVNHDDPTKTTYAISDVTDNAEAQRIIAGVWEYIPAAAA